MYHDATVSRYWGGLFTDFAGFQIVVCDRGDEVVAAGHCIPVFWDETAEGLPAGLDGVLEQGVRDFARGTSSNGGLGPPGDRIARPPGTRPQQRGPHHDEDRCRRKRARGPDRARPSHAQGAVSAHPDGALLPVGAPRRTTLRPLVQGPPEARRGVRTGRAPIHGHHRNDLRVGGVDRTCVSPRATPTSCREPCNPS